MVSIHAPREGCDKKKQLLMAVKVVSIHAPREGCDMSWSMTMICRPLFQFTHPGRGATMSYSYTRDHAKVSIHAPREGCDCSQRFYLSVLHGVSIHAPREGCDLVCTLAKCHVFTFQFTHPGRGATPKETRAV